MEKQGFLRQNRFLFSVIQKVVDAGVIVATLFIGAALYGIDWTASNYLMLAFCAVVFFAFFSDISGLGNSWRGQTIGAESQAIFYSWIGTILCLLLLGYATKTTASFSRITVGGWMILTPILLLVVRSVIRFILFKLREQGFNSRTIAIVGTDEVAQNLAREIMNQSWMGLKIAGYYDNRAELRSKPDPDIDINVIGRFDDLINAAKNNEYDGIYIALPMRAETLIAYIVNELSDCSVPVHIVPDLFTFNLITSRATNIGRIPLLSVYDSPFDEMGMMLKRTQDIFLGFVILTVFAVPMLMIAIAVKLSSRGPVLFKQRRYGLGGEEILVWKFRTMNVCEDGINIKQARKKDPRFTPIGKFLRQTSLDELPQFINVISGSMSIVGPRPHAVAHNEIYRSRIDGYMLRHLVKPGITGWAQINGWRGETDTDEKMERRIEADLEYVRNWSIWLDLKIIALTALNGFTNKNAY
jgi:putative colanic acid biosynthesis UDP-glucose lipid carrier transferase